MKLFRKTDIFVVLAVVLLACGLAFLRRPPQEVPAAAEIYLGNRLLMTLPLEQAGERSFSVPERPDVVLELDGQGGIRFLSSDCPDKICVNTGWLRLAGQTAACLPNGIVLRVVPLGTPQDGAPDYIAG